MRCIHRTKENNRCKAYALHGREFCFTHDPSTAEARGMAVRKGGLSPKSRRPGRPLKRLPVRRPSEMLILLEDTINRVRTDPMTPQQATCIGSLVSLAIRASEMEDPYSHD